MDSRRGRQLRATRSRGTGSSTVAVLEDVWSKVRTFAKQYAETELPHVQLITGSGALTSPVGTVRLGHFAPEVWEARKREGRTHELFVSGETLGLGAESALTTVLHEATHVLCWVRRSTATTDEDRKRWSETTRQNRYHNRRFVDAAATFGLEYVHGRPHDLLGYSAVTLSDMGRVLWGEELWQLDATVPAVIGGLQLRNPDDPSDPRVVRGPDPDRPVSAPAAPQRRRHTYTCGCRSILVHADEMALGPITCNVCGNDYTDGR